MANERLRAAIASSGLSVEDVSARIGVDPKTLHRWITLDRLPHRGNRERLALLLGSPQDFLWPATYSDGRVHSASRAEFVDIYPNRGSVPHQTWCDLIDGAVEGVDLLAFAASFLHDTIPDFDDLLVDRASAGARVRLLFGDPDSDAVRLRGEEEQIGDSLSHRCQLTWRYLAPILGTPGIEARAHGSTLYASLFRSDNELLVNQHAFGAPANHSPVLHLHRVPGGRMFANQIAAFERVWDSARPVDVDRVA